MENKMIGFELAPLKEGEKIVTVKVPGLEEYLKEQFGKNADDYIKEFLIVKRNYDFCSSLYTKGKKDALPDDIEKDCPKCGKQRELSSEFGNCGRYYLQMDMTFLLAATEFVNIVLKHRYIYDNKKVLLNLTINFYECLYFIKGEGKLVFDLDKMCRYCLHAGFISIASIFSKSEALNNLKMINEALNELDQKELEHKVLQTEDESYLELQKDFFEKKQRYYKEKLLLEKNTPINKIPNSVNRTTPTISQYCLFYYYLQESKDFPSFENHPNGKLAAIKELIEKEKINTSIKNFQLEYNSINNYPTNRVARNKIKNISYVANVMLANYPEAKKLALKELELAEIKSR